MEIGNEAAQSFSGNTYIEISLQGVLRLSGLSFYCRAPIGIIKISGFDICGLIIKIADLRLAGWLPYENCGFAIED